MAVGARVPTGFELLAESNGLGRRRPRRAKPRLVLGVGKLFSTDVMTATNGKIVQIVLPGSPEPIRVLRPERKQVVDDVLEVEGAITRAQLENPRQETPQVTQDRENLGRKVGILSVSYTHLTLPTKRIV